MWRGQSDLDWRIDSAAYRRLNKNRPVTEERMRFYEEGLIKAAAHQGYDYEQGRKLTDLELLAKLQHHGAATRLIDFSRNLLVALWFACDSQPEKIGLLLGIHTNHLGGYEGELLNGSYSDVLGDDSLRNHSYPQTWQPPVVTKRIAAQAAQFLYSSVSDDPAGSLSFEKDADKYLAIALTPKFKKKMLLLLECTFDIRRLTLFPDLDGFSIAHGQGFRVNSNYRW